jgi:hypothetical protein
MIHQLSLLHDIFRPHASIFRCYISCTCSPLQNILTFILSLNHCIVYIFIPVLFMGTNTSRRVDKIRNGKLLISWCLHLIVLAEGCSGAIDMFLCFVFRFEFSLNKMTEMRLSMLASVERVR